MDALMPNATTPARRRLWPLWAVLIVSAAPLVAALLAWNVQWPGGRSNYGAIIEPPRATPELMLGGADSQPVALRETTQPRHWRMVVAAPAVCEDACRKHLYYMRQLRTAAGEDRDRIERIWIVTDGGQPDAKLLADYPGMTVLRATGDAERAAIARWLDSDAPEQHLHLLDPHGDLMLVWPATPDPARMRRDLSRLLKVSRIG